MSMTCPVAEPEVVCGGEQRVQLSKSSQRSVMKQRLRDTMHVVSSRVLRMGDLILASHTWVCGCTH